MNKSKKKLYFYQEPWFAAGVLVLIFILSSGLIVNSLWQKTIGKINIVPDKGISVDAKDEDLDSLFLEEEEDLENPIPYDKDVTNILLLGIDSRDKDRIDERSDAMMILTINKTQKKIKLTSLQRDMLVPIPGMANMNKINSANVFGGPELAMQTVSNILRLNIDKYAIVNMYGLETIVDVVGGIEIKVPADAIPFVNKNIEYTNKIYKDTAASPMIVSAGEQMLDGRQSVAYARNRSTSGGDYDRMNYQQEVIQGIYTRFLDVGFGDKLNMLNEGLSHVTTNLTKNEMLGMMQSVLPILDNEIEKLIIPIEGYHLHYSGAAWLNLCDFNGMIPIVQEFIYGKEFPFDRVQEIPGAPNSSVAIEAQPVDDWVTPETDWDGNLLTEEPYYTEPSSTESIESPTSGSDPEETPSGPSESTESTPSGPSESTETTPNTTETPSTTNTSTSPPSQAGEETADDSQANSD